MLNICCSDRKCVFLQVEYFYITGDLPYQKINVADAERFARYLARKNNCPVAIVINDSRGHDCIVDDDPKDEKAV